MQQWEGKRKQAFLVNHINATGFVHLGSFWVGPRSPQFSLRDLGDSIRPVHQSHVPGSKKSGG